MISLPLRRFGFRSFVFVLLGALALGFSGCATAPVTYRTRTDLEPRLAVMRTVQAAPLDIEVEEISAGGGTEKHDELTERVGKNIVTALTSAHRLTPAPATADFEVGAVRGELNEVQALLRAITLNHMMPFGGPLVPQGYSQGALSYNVGPIDGIANALGCDAVLFIFVRDQYSTGGRKAVMALTMLAGAAAGVAITPAMGVTAASAALVQRDGTVLWFNHFGAAGLDLRTPKAAADWVAKLMDGLAPILARASTERRPVVVPVAAPASVPEA